jgi:hypothetical protein
MTGGGCPGGASVWSNDGVWLALNFSLPDPHNYLPRYSSADEGSNATFTAQATGDLNCLGPKATFERQGSVNASGDVTGSYQPLITHELE